jgi:hypothetical protein
LRQGTYSHAILTSLKAGLTSVGLNVINAVRPPILGARRELAGAINLTTGVAVEIAEAEAGGAHPVLLDLSDAQSRHS